MTHSPAPLTLNELLFRSGIDPATVVVFRHRPYEPSLNRILEWMVAERPDLFDCYQSTHARRTEAALERASYVAAFIRHKPKTALFAGLYEKRSTGWVSVETCLTRPCHRELMDLGMSGFKATEGREVVGIFDLERTEWHREWIGRLIINWPGLERSWYRWADRNSFEIAAIAPDSLLSNKMPDWQELVLTWAELSVMPADWRAALSHWRGIYLITDTSDGRQYVGSAAGSENLLQRWSAYSRSGHGGNKLLRERDPATFRFAILERLSPDLPEAETVRVENNWKERLHTRAPQDLNEN